MIEHSKSLLLDLTEICFIYLFFPAEGTSHWLYLLSQWNFSSARFFFCQNLWNPHMLHSKTIPVSSWSSSVFSLHFRLFKPKRKTVITPGRLGSLIFLKFSFARRSLMAFLSNHLPQWFYSHHYPPNRPWAPGHLMHCFNRPESPLGPGCSPYRQYLKL